MATARAPGKCFSEQGVDVPALNCLDDQAIARELSDSQGRAFVTIPRIKCRKMRALADRKLRRDGAEKERAQ
jgi:hypothetical protein